MNTLRKLICLVFGLAMSIGLSILVMIKGWGLDPQSYWWIIGVGFCGQIVAQLVIRAAGSDD